MGVVDGRERVREGKGANADMSREADDEYKEPTYIQ